jgi:hypothetical protein
MTEDPDDHVPVVLPASFLANPEVHAAWEQIERNRAELASTCRARLLEMVVDFQEDLDDAHEPALQLVAFGETIRFHVSAIGYRDPVLLTFDGLLPSGEQVRLIQHVSQLSFLLTAAPKLNPEPMRVKLPMGFQRQPK